jgi:hypothetical protein
MRREVRDAKEAIEKYDNWYKATGGWSSLLASTPREVDIYLLRNLYDEYKRLRESLCKDCHHREKDQDALKTLAETDLGD